MRASDFASVLLATCSLPLLCLLRARFLLHSGDLAGACRLTTIARVWSWSLLGGGTVFLAAVFLVDPPGLSHPKAIALLAAHVPIWFWSWTLTERVKERQDEAARLAAPTPRAADAGPAAPG